jgi:hypothetical protein
MERAIEDIHLRLHLSSFGEGSSFLRPCFDRAVKIIQLNRGNALFTAERATAGPNPFRNGYGHKSLDISSRTAKTGR